MHFHAAIAVLNAEICRAVQIERRHAVIGMRTQRTGDRNAALLTQVQPGANIFQRVKLHHEVQEAAFLHWRPCNRQRMVATVHMVEMRMNWAIHHRI